MHSLDASRPRSTIRQGAASARPRTTGGVARSRSFCLTRRQGMRSLVVGGGLALVGAGLCLLAARVHAQSHEDPGARSLYIRYCADCHGLSGHGDGPAAGGLQPPPADLTRSTLGRSELIGVIDGRRPVKGHGAPSMPAWGSIFSNQAGASGQRASTIRVEALADEVLLLREPSGKPEGPGPSPH